MFDSITFNRPGVRYSIESTYGYFYELSIERESFFTKTKGSWIYVAGVTADLIPPKI